MVINLHTTQSPVSRSERIKINENWQRIIEGLSRLQYQLNILAGGEEVDELIKRINDAIDTVSNALQDTKKAINDANKATTEAQEATTNANSAVQVVNESIAEATQMLENLETLQAQLVQMKHQLETATTGAETAALNANNAAKLATDIANTLNEVIAEAEEAAQRANNAAQVIDGWGTATAWVATVEYVKNNVTTYNGSTWQSLSTNINSVPSESNTDWILLAQRGVDGNGSVSKVANKSPDIDGNVLLIPADIGAETPYGAQEKANGIKEWVQAHGLGTDKPGLIASPDSLLNKTESGFWNVKNTPGSTVLPNDIEDFHVYVGMKADETNIYQTFLAISQETAKTYTRVIEKDGQTKVHKDDSGWIEGGGSGSGVGGGLKFSAETYDLPTTEESQKSWNLPEKSYVKNNDFMIVFHNGFYLSPTSWNISGDAFNGYVLNIPENPITAVVDNNVRIIIFKNIPTDGTERFSGNLLEDGTVSIGKLDQDVQDAINNVGTTIDIIDNLDSERTDAVLSAKQGNVLKKMLDSAPKTEVVNDLTTGGKDKPLSAEMGKVLNEKKILEDGGEIEGAVNFDTLATNKLYQVGVLTEGTVGSPSDSTGVIYGGAYSILEDFMTGAYRIQRLTQIDQQTIIFRTKSEGQPWNSWKTTEVSNHKSVAKVMNLGDNYAERDFGIVRWNNNTSSEYAEITLPTTVEINGIFEVHVTSLFANSDSTGGIIHRTFITSSNKTIHSRSVEIPSLSNSFAQNFYVQEPYTIGDKWLIRIYKRVQNNPIHIIIKYHSIGEVPNRQAFELLNSMEPFKVTQMNYTLSTNDYPIQKVTFSNDLKIQKGIPTIQLDPMSTGKVFELSYNANTQNDYGVALRKDYKDAMIINSQKDVRFFGKDDAWFSVQDLKQSVVDGKKKVASAISGKGVQTASDATFDQIATNISKISTGVQFAQGTAYVTQSKPGRADNSSWLRLDNIGFQPKTVIGTKVGNRDKSEAISIYHMGPGINTDVIMYMPDSGRIIYGGGSEWEFSTDTLWLQVDSVAWTQWNWTAYGFN